MKILNIENKCTGCSACMSICPQDCIDMKLNKEGFLYPIIDMDKCIKCYKCEAVCPALKDKEDIKPKKAYYGWHNDESIRKNSSSGGAFSALAETIISKGGIVFGAIYDPRKKEVLHVGSSTSEYTKQRKSKYVQSDVKNTFKEVKAHLEDNKFVLYSGTPCQISGLNNFLGIEYENLLTIDFMCHGVTPMKLLNEHLFLLEKRYSSKITELDFRPKEYGWSNPFLSITFLNNEKYIKPYILDNYYRGFMTEDAFLRKCCYECEFTSHHPSDIILADFWGFRSYKPELNDEKGISLLITNTDKGEIFLSKINTLMRLNSLDLKYTEYAYKEKNTPQSTIDKREYFFSLYEKYGFEKACKKSFMRDNYKNQIKYIIKKIIGKTK